MHLRLELGTKSGQAMRLRMGMRAAVAVALATWFLALVYFSSSLFSFQREAIDDVVAGKLRDALEGIRELREQNSRLKNLAEDERKEHEESIRLLKEILEQGKRTEALARFRSQSGGDKELPAPLPTAAALSAPASPVQGYTREHEELRRLVSDHILEAFFYAKAHVGNEKVDRKRVAGHLYDQMISLMGTAARFGDVNNATGWRKAGLRNLTDHLQSAITRIQNPADCSTAKIAVCNLDKQCGFGCQLHHVAYCFALAFGEGRALVLEGDGKVWRYSSHGWASTFLPISSCTAAAAINGQHGEMFSTGSTARINIIPIVDSLRSHPPHLPLAFPASIEDELHKLHANPSVFFVGQFLWYLMRSTPELEKHIDDAAKAVPFHEGPVVGLQVRRTDKIGTEAAFHGVDEYMEWAEIYFKVEEARAGGKVKRRVFIATDDPSVIKETREKYKAYEVFGDEKNANTAQLDSRYTDSSLLGVITDIQQLSRCSHLVCTFSSQVCRMGYELAQVRQATTGEEFHSLDDIYYFGGQIAHEQVAVEAYKAEGPDEMDLAVGDVVGIAGNHWNGFSKGSNRKTGSGGLYPSYKVVEKWRPVDFPAVPPLH